MTTTQTVQVGDRAKLVRTAYGDDGPLLAGTLVVVIGWQLGAPLVETGFGRRARTAASNLVVVTKASEIPAPVPPTGDDDGEWAGQVLPVWLAVLLTAAGVAVFLASMAGVVCLVNGY